MSGSKTAVHSNDITWQENGLHWNLTTVIGDFLRLVQRDAIAWITKNDSNGPVDLTTLRWIVTVPAIWTEKMKAIMKVACQEAGIIAEWCLFERCCFFVFPFSHHTFSSQESRGSALALCAGARSGRGRPV